jgi:antitoxin MazE
MQRLTRWGNSVGMRLPIALLEAAGLEPGDYVYTRLLDSGEILIRPTKGVQMVGPGGQPAANRARSPIETEW